MKVFFNIVLGNLHIIMFSNSVKYAIKAVLYLALNTAEDRKIMAQDISAEIDVPYAYMAKLLQEMVRHDLISSSKGPKGGFYLTKANRNLPLMRVVQLFDGETEFTTCVLGLSHCDESRPCPLHEKISPFRWSLQTALEFNTIQDFADDLGRHQAYLPQ